MIDHRNRKKKLIISYKNLPDNIRELFKDAYPDGYKDYLQKTIKPNGEPIFVVPLETDDTSYMVKFDVKIDTGLVEEDLDKDLYGGDEEQSEGEFAPLSEAIDKEEGNEHAVGKMRHGALEEVFEGLPEDKKEFEMANQDIEDEYGDRPDEDDDIDSYIDGEKDGDDDIEPDDDELLDIEALLNEADSGEGMLRENNPPEEKRGRKRKSLNPDIEAVKAVGSEAKALKKSSKAKTTVKIKKSEISSTTKVKAVKVTKAVKEPKAVKVTKAVKEPKAVKVTKAVKETKAVKVTKAVKEPKAVKVTKAVKEPKAVKVTKAVKEPKAVKVTKAVKEPKAVKMTKAVKEPKAVKVTKAVKEPKAVKVTKAVKEPKAVKVTKAVKEPQMSTKKVTYTKAVKASKATTKATKTTKSKK